MRHAILAVLVAFAFVLPACTESEPPRPAGSPPAGPRAQGPASRALPAALPEAPSADERLLARVRQALRDARDVDGQGVEVAVAAGAVSLFGTASSEAERRRIEQLVARLEGVAGLVSRLIVVQGS